MALVPWLLSLRREQGLAGVLLNAAAMSVAYTAAVFAWFGSAVGSYTQLGAGPGLVLLLLGAPLFQPQFQVFAAVRHVAGRGAASPGGRVLAAGAGAAAWVAAEWCIPRLLGDTLGHGLYPARLLRQAADLGGAPGLTLVLLLTNEALAAALGGWGEGRRRLLQTLAIALAGPLLLAGYGWLALAALPSAASPAARPLRLGLVQSNLHDYERLRAERGAGAVVREVLDTHYAMSYDAVERQQVDAVLWSETVYPTTFGRPKNEVGAELDQEILAIVQAAGVPLVFGTYDRDAAGEYNAAAFVAPDRGWLGSYRKTRLFPLTEWVPAWLDGPVLRRWLRWAGTWQAGSGARVLPLQWRDGREIPVLPLICLDDVDAGLAIDGARLGAQALLTLSNDAWFTSHPQGARLHQAVAAFRSIETRLPQFRVTTTGYSSAIDNTGEVIASTRLGERALLVSSLPLVTPPRTLMLAWGDWVGRAAACGLVVLALGAAARRSLRSTAARQQPPAPPAPLPSRLIVLPPAARVAAGLLRAVARGALVWMLADILLGDSGLASRPLAMIRQFAVWTLAPELAAWCVLRAFSARSMIVDGCLVLTRGTRQRLELSRGTRQRLELDLRDVVAVERWRLPWPCPGLHLRLQSGERWPLGLAQTGRGALATILAREARQAGAAPGPDTRRDLLLRWAEASEAGAPHGLANQWFKFGLFPLLLAIPAFRLHQHIAYGSSFGEYLSAGALAYATTLAVWWASWIIGVVLSASVVRMALELGTLAVLLLHPEQAAAWRSRLERIGWLLLYGGLPAWLLWRMLGD